MVGSSVDRRKHFYGATLIFSGRNEETNESLHRRMGSGAIMFSMGFENLFMPGVLM